MNELPDGWEWATLGAIAETQLGKMLSTKSKTGVRARPYLRNINVQWHRIDLDDLPEMDFTEGESVKYELVPGDLLVCEGGEVGRTATWRGATREMHFQKALHRVRPLGGIEPKYLEYAMRWSADTGRFARLVTGSTIAHLPQQALREVSIPVPPLPEQRRIVAAIEEHFSRLDAAEASVRAARSRLELLLRASTERLLSSQEWGWTTLGEISDIRGGVTKDAKREREDDLVEVPFLRVANVQRGYLDLDEVKAIRVPRAKADALELQMGDILFNEGGDRDKLGRGWIWEGQIDRCIHQNHVFRARLKSDQFEPRFVSTHGNTWGRKWFEKNGKQTTNLASLNLTTLRRFPVPDAPRAEQRTIVAELERVEGEIARAEDSVATMEVRSSALRRSILTAAFSGRLVSQDPSDEPASVLLERIVAEREASKPTRAKKGTS